MKIYLAGGMHAPWRKDIIEGVTEYFIAHGWKAPEFIDPCAWNSDDEAEYTRKDLEAIDAADFVVGRMTSDNPSGYGLCVEMGYATAKGIPTVWYQGALGERERYFGMCRAMATKHARTIYGVALALISIEESKV